MQVFEKKYFFCSKNIMMDEGLISYEDFQKKKIYDRKLKFCVYRDRCHSEVLEKMRKISVEQDLADAIMTELISENVLNEERYARSFARRKFRLNKWGKNKIKAELAKKQIPKHIIVSGLEEIDEDEYFNTLVDILEQKARSVKGKNSFEKNSKLRAYAYSRGYEPEVINTVMENMT